MPNKIVSANPATPMPRGNAEVAEGASVPYFVYFAILRFQLKPSLTKGELRLPFFIF